jgi:hypothetical protein
VSHGDIKFYVAECRGTTVDNSQETSQGGYYPREIEPALANSVRR